MKLTAFALVLSLTAVACATVNGQPDSPSALAVSTVADDQALVERLVSATKWAGTWTPVGFVGGTQAFRFYREGKGSGLAGEFLEGTGSPLGASTPTGPFPVKFLEIRNGVLTFSMPTGSDYRLVLQPDGCFGGGITLRPYPQAQIRLCPQ